MTVQDVGIGAIRLLSSLFLLLKLLPDVPIPSFSLRYVLLQPLTSLRARVTNAEARRESTPVTTFTPTEIQHASLSLAETVVTSPGYQSDTRGN